MKSIIPKMVLVLGLATLLGVGWYVNRKSNSSEAESLRNDISELRHEIRTVLEETKAIRDALAAAPRVGDLPLFPHAREIEGEGEGALPQAPEEIRELRGVPADKVRRDELAPGLVAEFFALPAGLFEDFDFRPELRDAVRLDPVVDFDWGDERPHELVEPDEFAIRWSGYLDAPKAGEYLLVTRSDDGVRLYVDETRLIDHWDEHGPATDRVRVRLSAGLHRIRLEHFDTGGGAVCRLWWRPPGAERAGPIPAERLLHSPDAVPEGVPEVEPAPTF